MVYSSKWDDVRGHSSLEHDTDDAAPIDAEPTTSCICASVIKSCFASSGSTGVLRASGILSSYRGHADEECSICLYAAASRPKRVLYLKCNHKSKSSNSTLICHRRLLRKRGCVSSIIIVCSADMVRVSVSQPRETQSWRLALHDEAEPRGCLRATSMLTNWK